MSWFKQFFGAKKVETAATPDDFFESIGRALREHRDELQQALTPESRQKVFSLWRRTIDTNAHDYVDLVLHYPDRNRIVQLEVDTFMQAYLNGYMAAQNWIDPDLALQSAFMLGRRLRDQLRTLGVSLNSVSANVGCLIDQTLTEIVKLGLGASRLEDIK